MGAAPEGSVAPAPSPRATAKLPPFWPLCATRALKPLFWWKARSMPRSSRLTWSTSFVLACTRGTRLRSARGVGLRYLPPYSPDLNPIELAFAKLKAHLRQAAARTLEDLLAAVATALNSFSAQHCQGFFRQAQYASI